MLAAESAHAKTGYVGCKSMYKKINKFRKTKKVGVACYEYKGYKFWVQCFGA